MFVNCELLPRRDATAEELKALGTAVREWARRELKGGVLHSIDPTGLAALLAGELPPPLALQAAEHTPGADLKSVAEALGAAASIRSLRFTVKDDPHGTRQRVVESLRQDIPAGLVHDVLIDDVSCNE
jgi:hypothetical protein